jgi:hypothetical protein
MKTLLKSDMEQLYESSGMLEILLEAIKSQHKGESNATYISRD